MSKNQSQSDSLKIELSGETISLLKPWLSRIQMGSNVDSIKIEVEGRNLVKEDTTIPESPAETETDSTELESADKATQTAEFECPECDYATDTEQGLNIHIGRMHKSESDESDRLQCSHCDFEAANIQGLKSHERTHEESEDTFVCRYEGCGETYTSKQGRGSHEFHTHGQTKPNAPESKTPESSNSDPTAKLLTNGGTDVQTATSDSRDFESNAPQIDFPDNAELSDLPNIPLNPTTNRWKVAVTLYNTSGFVKAKRIGHMLRGTQWELAPGPVASALESCFKHGIVSRKKPKGEQTTYQLTEFGRTLLEATATERECSLSVEK